VQSVIARESSYKDNSGLKSNSYGIFEKALFVLIKQPARQVPCLGSPLVRVVINENISMVSSMVSIVQRFMDNTHAIGHTIVIISVTLCLGFD
jgi:hypothetical protein